MNYEEAKSRIFLRYGNCFELKTKNKEDYNFNKSYKFNIKSTLGEIRKTIVLPLNVPLYRNAYWVATNKELENIYTQVDLDGYIKNDSIVFNIQLKDNDVLEFKPDYVKNNNEFLHYFDMSYFVNNKGSERYIYKKILDYFDSKEDVIFNYIDYYDFNEY